MKGTFWLAAICLSFAAGIFAIWSRSPQVDSPRQQQQISVMQQSDAQVCEVGKPVSGSVLIGPGFIPIMKGPGRNTGRLVNQAGSDVLRRTVYVEVSGDEDLRGICETNDWILVKVVGAGGRKIDDGETGWIEKRYIVKDLTPDRKLGLFWDISKSDDVAAADRQWVRQGALKILADEKKCTRIVFVGRGHGPGRYYVTCTDPAGKSFNLEFQKSDVTSQAPILAPAPPVPFDELSSRELCNAAIKSHAVHPSTVDIKTFTGYGTRTSPIANREIIQYFTAQNAFGLKLSYHARCIIEPDNAGLDTVLESGLKQGPQAVIQLGSPLIRQAGTRTAEILSARRMPGISQFRTFPDGGGLMSYGPDLINLYRRLGPILGKILRGAHPADLPIERPTKFELVINLNAAKALGVTIPGSLLATADDVIE